MKKEIKLKNLKGAAKKVLEKGEKAAYLFSDETANGNYGRAIAYGDVIGKVISALDNGEKVEMVLVKKDPHTEYPETLTLAGYNTVNKAIAKDKKGVEIVLQRTKRGVKYPKEISNYFRISKTAAIYFPALGQVDADAANAADENDEEA